MMSGPGGIWASPVNSLSFDSWDLGSCLLDLFPKCVRFVDGPWELEMGLGAGY